MQVAGHLLHCRPARIRVRIDALLQARLGSGKVGQCLFAVAIILAQLLLQVGQFLFERRPLFRRQCLVLRDLLLHLFDLVSSLGERLLDKCSLGQHRRLWVRQHYGSRYQRQWNQCEQQRSPFKD